jgi:hypothetical protein
MVSMVLAGCGQVLTLTKEDPAPPAAPADAATDAGVIETGLPQDASTDALPEGGELVERPLTCPGGPSCTRHVFVTGPVTPASLRDDEADKTCMSRVVATNQPELRGRTYRAWISTADRPASERLVHGTGPYLNAAGVVVAANWAALTADGSNVMITIDELGNLHNGGDLVWTGTTATGALATANCVDWHWAGADLAIFGIAGIVGANGKSWTEDQQLRCDKQAMLYCIEE